MPNQMKENSKRVMITMNKNVCDKLDAYCDELGINKSMIITLLVSQYLNSLDTLNGAMRNAISSITNTEKQE